MRTARFSFALLLVYLAVGALAWAQGGATLSGIVVDQTYTALTGVSLTLSSLDRVFQAKTASDGLFRFQNVPPGAYGFEVAAPGFVKQKLNLRLSQGENRQLRIVLIVGSMPDMDYCGPHPTIKYEISDPNERQLVGTVSDYLGGRRIAGAKIALFQPGDKKPLLTCRSDRAGKFVFKNPPAGTYTLQISRTGYRQENVTKLLVPREDKTHVDVTMLQRNRIVVCQ
ncbi:MAG: MSCRAMM family protein [Bryobacteraceae bacterium]